jgi:uncharacterized phage protein (TIGR02216 family)
MSDRFSDGAARLAGLVPRLLGWSPEAFWNATPAELAVIVTPALGGEPLARTELERLMERDTHG